MRFNQVLALILLVPAVVHSQSSSSGYRIAVIDGEGALNNLATKAARAPVIQVSDANHHPVAGAYVEFDAPGTGAGGTFANGNTHFATTTNADGLAVASNLRNNGVAGAFLLTVHVSFQGQSVGETRIHQTNVSPNVLRHLQPGAATGTAAGEVPENITLSNNVLGIALGDQFLVNGASTPSNANLLNGTHIQALDGPTTLYLHEGCEYILGPHSAVTVGIRMVTLEAGSVRARRFGNCRIMYGGLWIGGAPNTDGVVSVTGQRLDLAAISGNIQVFNGAGEVINTITPGAVSSLRTSPVTSGASIGGTNEMPFKKALLLGSGAAVALAGLGLAADAMLQPASSGTPTSP